MGLTVYLTDPTATYETEPLFEYNVTHNLTNMAKQAGVYTILWRPEELGCHYAMDIQGALSLALVGLYGRPNHFKQYNPPNGWGNYDVFVKFLESYHEACSKYPEAKIEISR